MHELGIAESALRAAQAEMERHGAAAVTRLTLRIGELAAVDPEALRFAFEAVTPGTPLAGAVLEIETVAGTAWCRACAREFHAGPGFIFQCPACGGYSGELRRGREIELARLELQT